MATLKVQIENGFFTETNGCYVSVVEPTRIIANGWDCFIKEDGTVECNAVREYSDGEHSMRYAIQPNGFAKLTLKVPGKKTETLRKGFVVQKGSKLSRGTIGLAGGYIDSRYAYFRDSSFQEFLEDHDIKTVKHEDPNRIYELRHASYGGGDCKAQLITDGVKSEESVDSGRTEEWQEFPNSCAYESETRIKVTNATWVIHKQSQHEGSRSNCFSILYTLEKDVKKLVGIPNLKEKREKISILSQVCENVYYSIEELEAELKKVLPNLKRKGSLWEEPEEGSKFYGFLRTNREETEVWFELRTCSPKEDNRYYNEFWTAKL